MTTLRDKSVHPRVTTGPISGSHKVYAAGVPARRIELTNGDHLDVYDTSGPYTDTNAEIDLNAGLPPLRADWIAGRGAGTQLGWAKAGVATEEMRFVAARRSGARPPAISSRSLLMEEGPLDFQIATGASAGNINAFLAALTWCDQEGFGPRENLFWDAWINIWRQHPS